MNNVCRTCATIQANEIDLVGAFVKIEVDNEIVNLRDIIEITTSVEVSELNLLIYMHFVCFKAYFTE